MQVRNEIKAYIARSGKTLTEVVESINKTRPEDKQETVANLSNKLTRGTLKYKEALVIANALGLEIEWIKKAESIR